MYLRNKVTGQEVFLAKYLPSEGWYVPKITDITSKLRTALNENESPKTMYGGNDWVIEYEIEDGWYGCYRNRKGHISRTTS